MKHIILVMCAVLTLANGPVFAQSGPSKDQLKVQFKAREAELKDLKKSGKVGETIDGYVDAVDASAAGDQKISQLLSAENQDRRALYQILADEINKENPKAPVQATVETLATRNAMRNIERAGPDEFLRVADDHWIRVKDFPRFQKLTKFKTQGKVGETSAGTVEIVQAADSSDGALAALVDEENSRRSAEYKAVADKERVDVSVVARRMGERNVLNARIGDMVKDNGTWRKK